MGLEQKILPGNLVLMEAKTETTTGEWFRWPGGSGSYQAFGTFGGADSIKLQMSLDGGETATDVTDGSFTGATVGEFKAGICHVRAVATIADTSSLNMILGVPRV